MGKILKLHPVKLISGLIFKDQNFLNIAKVILIKHFGGIDFESPALSFNYTDYYKEEFGPDLKRIFISFKKLIRPETLPKIKLLSNRIEKNLSKDGKRFINIDPGYLDLAKLILASKKDFSHRIYLGRGIFAEVTLVFKGKSFWPWAWTYPDYKSARYIEIFNKIRDIYAEQIKKGI